MKITVLIENTSDGSLTAEHGLSLHIAHNGSNYLVDTGASGAFADNAEKLGIDLTGISAVFLSHGHYDHAGGLMRFFEINSASPVYLQKTADGAYYSKRNDEEKYIGIPAEVLTGKKSRLCFLDGCAELKGIHIIPHGEKTLALSAARAEKAGLFKKSGGGFYPDDFSHEQNVVFDTANGLVIINSCSHAGADIIAGEISSALPGKKLYAYIGGFHLASPGKSAKPCLSEAEIIRLGQNMQSLGVEKIYTGHCTGDAGYNILKSVLGEKLYRLTTGMSFEL